MVASWSSLVGDEDVAVDTVGFGVACEGDVELSLVVSVEVNSASVGFGVDWFTVIGPLNFSIAQPITKADTDKTESFRFNIGTTF